MSQNDKANQIDQTNKIEKNVNKPLQIDTTSDSYTNSNAENDDTNKHREIQYAVVGCTHGELDVIYNEIQEYEQKENLKMDFLLCCGDFQAVRNPSDLQYMAVLKKYAIMHDFHKYYSGKKVAPILTIVIGGNHEASNYMQELPYGGWLAPKIYYMGYCNVINIGGLRISGLSGIYKRYNYPKHHYECVPYGMNKDVNHFKKFNNVISVYHTRKEDELKLCCVKNLVDIFMSHDWPIDITNFGNSKNLIRNKKHLESDIINGQLGSLPAQCVINQMKPKFAFAAHLHVNFKAEIFVNNESVTKFFALGKPNHYFKHLQFNSIFPRNIDMTDNGDLNVSYDLEWLSILRATNYLNTFEYVNVISYDYKKLPDEADLEATKQLFGELKIPNNFTQTAPPFTDSYQKYFQSGPFKNPQNTVFMHKLGIDDPVELQLNKDNRSFQDYFKLFQRNEKSDIQCLSQMNTTKDEGDIVIDISDISD
ncbi:Lariat debranching enzyme [Intoshia linei]|uniref:Lariat debranching enzyme n=1 Tax=Intoshia linei TaxID=1819745 RepID=A0A177B109_9BILA|nr:Lariat debranching enzyme [Intoshia linei]